MSNRDEQDQFFQADVLDEQLARLTRDTTSSANTHLVHDLRAISREYTRSGEQVWQRLAARQAQQNKTPRMLRPDAIDSNNHTERLEYMQTQSPENNTLPSGHPRSPHRARRVFPLVAALLVIAVVIGGLATVLELSHQKSRIQTGSGQGSPTPALSPTSVLSGAPGHVIYSSPQENGYLNNLAWSADDQRVAALVGGQVQIWDATTGKHAVTVQLPGGNNFSLLGLFWSPTGELLAIPAGSAILIVNGQTGHIVTTYTESLADSTAAINPSMGGGHLDSRFSRNAGYGFMALTWSPDGKKIGTVFTSPTESELIQIWNTETGQISSTLPTQIGTSCGDLSWSPDGKDIAEICSIDSPSSPAATPSPTATTGSPSSSKEQVVVWNLATQQIVFQKSSELIIDSLSWQPGSTNLAFFTVENLMQNTVNPAQGLQIWDVTTSKLLKFMPYQDGITWVWSPDGKEIAYTYNHSAQSAEVSILNIASGQTVSPYKVSMPGNPQVLIGGLAWSSDGKYLANSVEWTPTNAEALTPTSTGNLSPSPVYGQPSYEVQVWVA